MLSSSLATTNRLDPTGTAADASHIPKCLVIGECVPAVTGNARTMATKMTATDSRKFSIHRNSFGLCNDLYLPRCC